MEWIHTLTDWALRACGMVWGFLFLYVAFFLYEDEEGRLQNALENAWLRIADRSDPASLRVQVLLTETSRFSSLALDRVFGHRLLSRQSIGVSFCYVAGSMASYPYLLYGGRMSPLPLWVFPLCFFAIGSLPAAVNRPWAARGVFLLPLSFTVFFAYAVAATAWIALQNPSADPGPLEITAALSTALVLAVLADFGWIVLTRAALASMRSGAPLYRLIGFFTGSVLVLVLGLLPVVWPTAFLALARTSGASMMVVSIIFLVLISRLFIVATAVLFVVVLAIILLHRLMWPLLGRAVYSVARHKVLQNRKVLGSLGFALMTTAIWRTPVSGWLGRALGLP